MYQNAGLSWRSSGVVLTVGCGRSPEIYVTVLSLPTLREESLRGETEIVKVWVTNGVFKQGGVFEDVC